MRLSNFLLWQSAYAEFVFLPMYWPDFGAETLAAAIDEFATRHAPLRRPSARGRRVNASPTVNEHRGRSAFGGDMPIRLVSAVVLAAVSLACAWLGGWAAGAAVAVVAALSSTSNGSG